MAIVDDKYILDLEKLRSKLVNILREKGLLVNEDETLANLVPMVDNLIEKKWY